MFKEPQHRDRTALNASMLYGVKANKATHYIVIDLYFLQNVKGGEGESNLYFLQNVNNVNDSYLRLSNDDCVSTSPRLVCQDLLHPS